MCVLCKMNEVYREKKISEYAPMLTLEKGEIISVHIYESLPNRKKKLKSIIVAKDNIFSKKKLA